MCVRAVAVGNVGAEGDEAVGVCVERWGRRDEKVCVRLYVVWAETV